MNRKIPLWLLFLVVFVGLNATAVFGYLVRRAIIVPEFKYTHVGTFVRAVAEYPSSVKEALIEIGYEFGILKYDENDDIKFPPQLIPNEFPRLDGFKRDGVVQPGALTDKGYLLLGIWDNQRGQSVGRLIRIRDQKIVYEWVPDLSWIRIYKLRELIKHPILLEDGGLLFHPQGGQKDDRHGNLTRIDHCSRSVWINKEYVYHHSNNLGFDGNYWIPANIKPSPYSIQFGQIYMDNAIVKVSPKGKVLFVKSVTQLLEENGYRSLIYGVANYYDHNPLHLNDIQPAHRSTKYWKQGDLLLSLRNKSTVLLYRPSTNKVIWLKIGPWIMQHDVNFVNDSKVSVFGNDIMDRKGPKFINLKTNNVYVYDLSDGSVSTPYAEVMERLDVRTPTAGLQTILKNGDVWIEETDRGRLLRLSTKEVVWEYVSKVSEKAVGLSSWGRYLTEEEVENILPILENANCNG